MTTTLSPASTRLVLAVSQVLLREAVAAASAMVAVVLGLVGPLKALRVVEYENHGFGVNQHAQKPFQK
jgi:hypothetical protein